MNPIARLVEGIRALEADGVEAFFSHALFRNWIDGGMEFPDGQPTVDD